MTKKLIALTFDDGPSDTTTTQVLDKLEKYGVRASFFLIGENITPERIPHIKRALSLGCQIENHSWTHSDMRSFTTEQIRKEIADTSRAITEITGREPKFFRPPYINVNEKMIDAIDLTFICGIGCEDWEPDASTEHRIKGILDNANDGVLYLLHDFEGNTNTVEALDVIIPELKQRGFEFVTCEEIFERKGVDPAKLHRIVYSHTDQTENEVEISN